MSRLLMGTLQFLLTKIKILPTKLKYSPGRGTVIHCVNTSFLTTSSILCYRSFIRTSCVTVLSSTRSLGTGCVFYYRQQAIITEIDMVNRLSRRDTLHSAHSLLDDGRSTTDNEVAYIRSRSCKTKLLDLVPIKIMTMNILHYFTHFLIHYGYISTIVREDILYSKY